ncbi:helix-turn-helix transcriptional regulator [uncultured Clostridium sp.]|uniref:helix-turn-helix domain-containing protein n=1 Tax=uncultured Clostridium sp. TaxID=59620 RepID=UPI0028E28566|nr:helix-turn-helix transcriptional regulator [uncultured Clostridium sp.]
MKKLINDLPWNTKLKILRIAKGWTQSEAAKRCCTNQKMYWSWENGKSYPRMNSQVLISQVYDVKRMEIFTQSEMNFDC